MQTIQLRLKPINEAALYISNVLYTYEVHSK